MPEEVKPTKEFSFEYVQLLSAWGKTQKTNGGFVLGWVAKEYGFGELTFSSVEGYIDEVTGNIEGAVVKCDSETMGKDFVRAALLHFANTVEIK